MKTLGVQYHNSIESSPTYKDASPNFKSSVAGLKSLKTKIVKIGEQGFSEKIAALKNDKN